MLIEFKVKAELPIVLLLLHSFEWFKQISDKTHCKFALAIEAPPRDTQDSPRRRRLCELALL